METAKTRGQRKKNLRQAFRVRLTSLKNVHDIRALKFLNLFFSLARFPGIKIFILFSLARFPGINQSVTNCCQDNQNGAVPVRCTICLYRNAAVDFFFMSLTVTRSRTACSEFTLRPFLYLASGCHMARSCSL